jgi:YbgC/YbaW family acyl-CoA thioester hydrolase
MHSFKVPAITKSIFNTMLEVRISDINYGNHLGHDAIVSLFHEARMRFLRKFGYENESNIGGVGVLITNLIVNYINESFYSDKLTIHLEIGEMTRTSLQLLYQAVVVENNKEIARALTTMTFYDYQKSKVTKIPQQFLSSMELMDLYKEI